MSLAGRGGSSRKISPGGLERTLLKSPNRKTASSVPPGADVEQMRTLSPASLRVPVRSLGMEGKIQNFSEAEIFDYEHVDSRALKLVPELSHLTANRKQFSNSLTQALRLVLYVATLCSVASSIVSNVPDSVFNALHGDAVNILGLIAQFAPIPIGCTVLLAVNNYFAQVQYLAYLTHGAIIDFESSSKSTLHRRFSLIALLYFGMYVIFITAILFLFKAKLSHFIIVFCCVVGVISFWKQEQTACRRMLSLEQFLVACSSSSSSSSTLTTASLHSAAKCLPRMSVLSTQFPTFATFWMNSFLRSSAATGKHRFLVKAGVTAVVVISMATVAVYIALTYERTVDGTWVTYLNPCVASCAIDFSRGGAVNSSRCAPCLCACARNFQRSLSSCASQFSVVNCTVDACVC